MTTQSLPIIILSSRGWDIETKPKVCRGERISEKEMLLVYTKQVMENWDQVLSGEARNTGQGQGLVTAGKGASWGHGLVSRGNNGSWGLTLLPQRNTR